MERDRLTQLVRTSKSFSEAEINALIRGKPPLPSQNVIIKIKARQETKMRLKFCHRLCWAVFVQRCKLNYTDFDKRLFLQPATRLKRELPWVQQATRSQDLENPKRVTGCSSDSRHSVGTPSRTFPLADPWDRVVAKAGDGDPAARRVTRPAPLNLGSSAGTRSQASLHRGNQRHQDPHTFCHHAPNSQP